MGVLEEFGVPGVLVVLGELGTTLSDENSPGVVAKEQAGSLGLMVTLSISTARHPMPDASRAGGHWGQGD